MSDPSFDQYYGYNQYVTNEAHMICLPRNYRGVKRAVVYCGGWSSNALMTYNNPDVSNLTGFNFVQSLCRQGIPVITADLGAPTTTRAGFDRFAYNFLWGNDAHQSRITSLWNYAIANYGIKSDKMILWGGSMGGAVSTNYARNNPTVVAALGLANPAIDIQDIHDNRYAAFQNVINAIAVLYPAISGQTLATNIEAAYGGSSGYTSALPTHNPNTTANTASLKSSGIPVAIWHSTTDPFVNYNVVVNFAKSISAQKRIEYDGGGHGVPAALVNDPSPQTNWLAQYA